MASDWNSWNTRRYRKGWFARGYGENEKRWSYCLLLILFGFLLREIAGFVIWIVFNT